MNNQYRPRNQPPETMKQKPKFDCKPEAPHGYTKTKLEQTQPDQEWSMSLHMWDDKQQLDDPEMQEALLASLKSNVKEKD